MPADTPRQPRAEGRPEAPAETSEPVSDALPTSTHHRFWLKISRLEALSDGIFAISMTLLVLSLNIPEVNQQEAQERLWDVMSDNAPMFQDYALSFFLLANFWLIHHRHFRFIRRIDEKIVWMNILVLALVALVPFTTEVINTYNDAQSAALMFEGNLLAIGVVYFIMWYYATANYRLVDERELARINITYSRAYNLVLPVISLLAMAFSFLSPSWSEALYLLVPFTIAMLHRFEPVRPLENQENY